MKKTNPIEQLKSILYRKGMLEHQMSVLNKGGAIYDTFCSEIVKKLKRKDLDNLDRSRMEVELDKNKWICRNFIQSYKECEREYQYHTLPTVEELMKSMDVSKEDVQFVDCSKIAKDLVTREIYGKTTVEPANVEHVSIIDSIERLIKITKDLIESIPGRIESETDAYEIAKLNKEMYDSQLHLITLEKRISVRKEYYYEHFLPKFNKESEEAKVYIHKYMDRAKEFVRLGIDIKLQLLLDEYEKHKNEDEKFWLFYTALKTRVNQIIEFISKTPDLHKTKIHLSQPIS